MGALFALEGGKRDAQRNNEARFQQAEDDHATERAFAGLATLSGGVGVNGIDQDEANDQADRDKPEGYEDLTSHCGEMLTQIGGRHG